MTRREAREQAFLLLFEHSFTGGDITERIEIAQRHRELVFDSFTTSLCLSVTEHVEEIDQKIGSHATRWSVGRLPRVTLMLLRMSIAEMDYMEDVPVSVSINEAVELCKSYGTEEDAAFLNGVLGAYARGVALPVERVEPPQLPISPGDEVDLSEDAEA